MVREGGAGALIAVPDRGAPPVLVTLAAPAADAAPPEPADRATAPTSGRGPRRGAERRSGPPALVPGGGVPVLEMTRAPSAGGGTADEASGGGVRGPQFASGRLWERALPPAPAGTAERYRKTHPELIDSAVTAMMATYLDSLAREAGFRAEAQPDWTTQVAGRTFGFQGPYVVIAGLKLPSALLGLLPIDGGPSPDQAKRAQQLMDMRDEIWRAAARAETYGDFKRAVRELRARTEEERAFQRAQREPMPPLRADTAAGGAQ